MIKKLDYLKCIDMFYVTPQLNLNGKAKFTTTIGTLMTILFIALTVLIVIAESSNMIKKENPVLRSQEKVLLNTPSYNFSEKSFIPLVSFINDVDFDSVIKRGIDPTYFTVDFIELIFKYSKNESNGQVIINETSNALPAINCEEQFFRGLIEDKEYAEKYFQRENISNYLCINDKELKAPLSLYGSWEDESMSLLALRIKICNNSTRRPGEAKCKSLDQMNAYLMNGMFQVNVLQSLPDLNDYSQPVKHYFSQIAFKAVLDKGKGMEIFLKQGLIETDDGELGESIWKKKFYTLSNYKETIISSDINLLGLIYLRFEKKEIQYFRKYEKIKDVFSRVGGSLNLLLFIMQFVVRYFSKLDYQVEVVNSFHCIDRQSIQPESKKGSILRKASISFVQKLKWSLSKFRMFRFDKGVYYDKEFEKINYYLDINLLANYLISSEKIFFKENRQKDFQLNRIDSQKSQKPRNSLSQIDPSFEKIIIKKDPFESLDHEICQEIPLKEIR